MRQSRLQMSPGQESQHKRHIKNRETDLDATKEVAQLKQSTLTMLFTDEVAEPSTKVNKWTTLGKGRMARQ